MAGAIPAVNAATTDEQGNALPGARPRTGPGVAPLPKIQSPLQLDTADDIAEAAGVGGTGAQRHLNPLQFGQGEGEEGAAEGAGAIGDIGEVAAVAAL